MTLNGTGEHLTGRGKKRAKDGDADYGTGRTKIFRASEKDTAGIIKKIRLENFMVHSEFEWEPNNQVNFVTGANGSGKSSVLQALVLGLNGEVKGMGRYQKAKDFIKKDSPKAIIQITLCNTGEDSFKPDTYRNEIIVQRSISETFSDFTIKGKDEGALNIMRGREAKEEIQRLLDKLQIQVNNPIAILHQEVAKDMLKVESPQSLYKFFEMATLIKSCQDEYQCAVNEIEKTKKNLCDKDKTRKALKKEYREISDKWDQFQKSLDISKEFEEVKGQLYWARIHELEDALKSAEGEIAKLEKRQELPKKKLLKLHEENGILNNEVKKLEYQISVEQEKCQKQETELAALKELEETDKNSERNLLEKIKNLTSTKNSKGKMVTAMTKQISNLTQPETVNDQERVATREIKLANLKEKKEDLENKIDQEGLTRDLQENKLKEEDAREKQFKKENDRIDEQISSISQDLKDMERMSNQQVAVYGGKFPLLQSVIKKNEKKFHRIPLGPLGTFIKLQGDPVTDQNLALLVENELGRSQLSSYLTTDDHDRRILTNIVNNLFDGREARNKPMIYTSRFLDKKHPIERFKVRSGFPILFDYLNIEDPNVFNHIVDQRKIEQIIVCKTQDEAKNLMTYKQNVPMNCAYTITHDWNRFLPASNNGSYRSYYIEQPRGSNLLKSTMSSQIEDKKVELNELHSKKTSNVYEIGYISQSKKSYQAEKKRALDVINKYRKEIGEINKEITKVKATQDDTGVSELESLRKEKNETEQELKDITEQIANFQNQRVQIREKLKDSARDIQKKRDEIKLIKSSESLELKEKQRDVDTKMKKKEREITNQEKLIKLIKDKFDAAKKKKIEDTKTLQSARKQALEGKYQEVFPEESIKLLREKADAIGKKLNVKNELNWDITKLKEDFTAIKGRYEKNSVQCENLKSTLAILEGMKTERKRKIFYIRDLITNCVRRTFNEQMKSLGKDIFLRINHQKRHLQFVSKNHHERSSDDISALSGGEKSYTQMCLITSLWDMMDPPFRCLDEWDVFLDAINRKEISKALLDFSLKNQDKQFIFISPQGACDLKNIPHGKVNVLEIKKSS